MSPTLCQLFFSLAVLMATVVVFYVTVCFVFDAVSFHWKREYAGAVACMTTIIFLAFTWTLVWRKQVKWNTRRIILTPSVFFACAGPAAICFIPGNWIDSDIRILLVMLMWAASWLIGTALVWRETASERAARLGAVGVTAIACPSCGYNLTGLHEARCPECGQVYTLDQLVGAIIAKRDETDRI